MSQGDEFDAFGKSVAHKLRRIATNNKEGASSAQIQIYQVIHKAEKGELNSSSAMITNSNRNANSVSSVTYITI